MFFYIGAPAQPRIIKVEDLKKMIPDSGDTLYIINFWATWCVPCVQEMPHFLALHKEITEKKLKARVLLVSLDYAEDYESKLLPFFKKHGLPGSTYLLDEINANYFIPAIDPKWSGTLPTTLALKGWNEPRRLHEGQLDENGLRELAGLEPTTKSPGKTGH